MNQQIVSATDIFRCQQYDSRLFVEVLQLKAVLVKQVFCINIS